MYVYMYVYMCIMMYVCVYAEAHTHEHTHTHTHTYTRTHVHACTYILPFHLVSLLSRRPRLKLRQNARRGRRHRKTPLLKQR